MQTGVLCWFCLFKTAIIHKSWHVVKGTHLTTVNAKSCHRLLHLGNTQPQMVANLRAKKVITWCQPRHFTPKVLFWSIYVMFRIMCQTFDRPSKFPTNSCEQKAVLSQWVAAEYTPQKKSVHTLHYCVPLLKSFSEMRHTVLEWTMVGWTMWPCTRKIQGAMP